GAAGPVAGRAPGRGGTPGWLVTAVRGPGRAAAPGWRGPRSVHCGRSARGVGLDDRTGTPRSGHRRLPVLVRDPGYAGQRGGARVRHPAAAARCRHPAARVPVPGHRCAVDNRAHPRRRRPGARHGVGMSTVGGLMLEAARRWPGADALVEDDTVLSHAEAAVAARRVARRLLDRGVRPGDRVALALPNGWRYAVAYYGVQLAGAVAVLVNTRFTPRENEYVLADSGAKYSVVDSDTAARVPLV